MAPFQHAAQLAANAYIITYIDTTPDCMAEG